MLERRETSAGRARAPRSGANLKSREIFIAYTQNADMKMRRRMNIGAWRTGERQFPTRRRPKARKSMADILSAADRPKDLEWLHDQIEGFGATPGWVDRAQPIMGARERSEYLPAHWRYSDVRAALSEAGHLVDVALSERRTMVLRNPRPGNDWATSNTLVCAYQMILPGEFAPSHRHTSHAFRFIIDGEGTYSVVNGTRMPMESGDVVLTPGSYWHGHGHDGDEPAYWLDGLDVPLTYLLEPLSYEKHPQRVEEVTEVVSASPFRFSRSDIERALDGADRDPEGRFGARTVLPTPQMPVMQIQMSRLEGGVATRSWRSTANRIMSVAEGSGTSSIGDKTIEWTRGDTFVVPFWNAMHHRPATDSVFLELSDEPLMRFANYYRHELL
jgi:gentisate 1,2-dioxygenase